MGKLTTKPQTTKSSKEEMVTILVQAFIFYIVTRFKTMTLSQAANIVLHSKSDLFVCSGNKTAYKNEMHQYCHHCLFTELLFSDLDILEKKNSVLGRGKFKFCLD